MKEKKDILFLCQYFHPEYVSSATLPYDTAKALVEAGFSVSALCGYPSEYNKTGKVSLNEKYEGIEIKRLKYLQLKRSNFFGRLINYFSFTFMVLLRIFNLRYYKLIIVYSNPPVLPLIAAWASKFFGTKMVFVSYDVYPEIAHVTKSISEDGIISKMMQCVNNMIYKNVNKVVALSNEMKEYLHKNREQLRDEQIEVIPNWYKDNFKKDIEVSYRNDKFRSLNPKDNLIVSYFGNMGICQDLDTILNAIRKLKIDNKVKFVFAGHGNKMDLLRNAAKEEDLSNVVVYNFLHGQDFQDALNISDCFLVSLAEGLTGLAVPSKTYSYMMSSKPVIAIMRDNADIARDLEDNNAGYTMQVGETFKLVSAIKELRDDEVKRKQMGENCRKVFLEKYTKEHCTQQYVKMMGKILEDKEYVQK